MARSFSTYNASKIGGETRQGFAVQLLPWLAPDSYHKTPWPAEREIDEFCGAAKQKDIEHAPKLNCPCCRKARTTGTRPNGLKTAQPTTGH